MSSYSYDEEGLHVETNEMGVDWEAIGEDNWAPGMLETVKLTLEGINVGMRGSYMTTVKRDFREKDPVEYLNYAEHIEEEIYVCKAEHNHLVDATAEAMNLHENPTACLITAADFLSTLYAHRMAAEHKPDQLTSFLAAAWTFVSMVGFEWVGREDAKSGKCTTCGRTSHDEDHTMVQFIQERFEAGQHNHEPEEKGEASADGEG